MDAGVRMKLLVTTLALVLAQALSSELQSPDIAVKRVEDDMIVSWTPIEENMEEECLSLYRFVYKVNGDTIIDVYQEKTQIVVPFTPCAEKTFVVAPRCRTGVVVAESSLKSYITSIHESMAVENLRIDHVGDTLAASWSRPSDADACDVSFAVTLKVNDAIIYETTTNEKLHNFKNLELPPCTTAFLTVTPFDAVGMGESATTTVVTSRGNAGVIRDLNVNNGRIEWTETQDNGECDVVYTVIIVEENGAESTHTTNEAFFKNNFVICSMYNILVISRIGENTISTLLTSHRSRPSEVGEVDDLAVNEVIDELVVKWSPIVIGACEVKYTVRHYINDVLVYSVITANDTHTLGTEFCAENLVTVQPIVDMIMGDETPVRITSSSSEPNPIEHLWVEKDEKSLEVSWIGVELAHCPMSYIVEHFVNSVLVSVDTVVGYNVTLERLSCSDNEIRVSPVAGNSTGSSTSVFINVSLQSLDPIADLKVTQEETALLVTWSPIVAGVCNVLYRITNFDGETERTLETASTEVLIEKTTCATNKVTVYGFEKNKLIRSEEATYAIDIDIDLTKVRNMAVEISRPNVIDVLWNNPADAYHCEISYLVEIRAEDVVEEIRTDELQASIEVEIAPCEGFEVIVTPISPGGVKGVPVSVQVVKPLFHIESVRNMQHINGLVSWERPPNAGICELEYFVFLSGYRPFEPLRTTSTEISVNMEPCASYVITIEAVEVSTGMISDRAFIPAIGHPRFIEQISNLEYKLNRENLSISWSPANVGACILSYIVEHEIDGILNKYSTQDTTAVLRTISCSSNAITVTPVLIETPEIIGDSLRENIKVDLDEIKLVQNVNILNNVLLTWDAPDYVGNCALEYLVEISEYGESEPVFIITTNDLAIEFEFVPCGDYIVTITPSHNGRLGVAKHVSLVGDTVALSPPEHVRTVPSLASATITLRADELAKNSCPIDEARIVCHGSNDESLDRIIQLEDNSERVFEFTLADLAHNTHYECKVQWLPNQSEFSKSFGFYTMDIPTKDLEVSNVTSNEITVSWEVPEGLGRYVLHFIVVITTVGPNHFVQERCDVERDYTRTIQLPANVFTFTFTEALPNFKYHFSLITSYSIGLDSKANLAVVNTPPAVPGPITDLAVDFSVEECAVYAGDGAFVWSPPCDINGELSEFKVTLSTVYRVGGEDFIHTIQKSLLPDSADKDYNFAVKIPTLNPFFVYSVAVETIAAYPGYKPAGLLDVIPPPAYSYCSA